MTKAKNDIRGDLSTMRRATEKVDAEVTKLEADKKVQVKTWELISFRIEKKQQQLFFKDLFVDRLVQQADSLREQISMYEHQLRVQSRKLE